jgi:hypothetical protein
MEVVCESSFRPNVNLSFWVDIYAKMWIPIHTDPTGMIQSPGSRTQARRLLLHRILIFDLGLGRKIVTLHEPILLRPMASELYTESLCHKVSKIP